VCLWADAGASAGASAGTSGSSSSDTSADAFVVRCGAGADVVLGLARLGWAGLGLAGLRASVCLPSYEHSAC
jgi:hypothetical protein